MPTTPIEQQSPHPGGQRAAAAKPAVPHNLRLWDRDTTCEFFGNIDISTLYRGMSAGRYPRPMLVSAHVARWLASECEAALERMIAERDKPKPPPRLGRKHGASAAKAKTDPETDPEMA